MLRVFTFSPNFGLPTAGPFALKLLAWLNLAGIPYEQVVVDNPRKAPKGKSPWIELDGEAIGDSEIIIELLGARYGFDIDDHLSVGEKADALAWRRMFEEHFHQVLEWELFLHPAGLEFMKADIKRQMPPLIGSAAVRMIRRHFRKQLFARGVSRHDPERIAAVARADLDALAQRLGSTGGPLLFGQKPSSADLAVFGLVAPVVFWPMKTPSAEYAKSLPAVTGYIARMRELSGMADEQAPAS
jgi:glutathione S-transferase